MLGKLFEILIASKTGALSGVLLLTGALVSVTTANGVTTITLDQQSPTPSVTVTATPTPTPTFTTTPTPTPTASSSPNAGASPAASTEPSVCAADAHARNDARHRIREAFTKYHTALMHLRGDEHGRLNDALRKADEMLKRIAKGADEALRDIGCQHRDNDDEDQDDDDRAAASASPSASPSPTPTPTPTPTSSAGTTAAAQMSEIADRAVAAMETVYNAAKALAGQPTPSPKHGERSHDKHHEQRPTPAPELDEDSD